MWRRQCFVVYIFLIKWNLIYAFSRCFYPKRLTVHSGYTFFFSMCASRTCCYCKHTQINVVFTYLKYVLLLPLWPNLTEYFKSKWAHRCLHLSCSERYGSASTLCTDTHFSRLTLDWVKLLLLTYFRWWAIFEIVNDRQAFGCPAGCTTT